MSLFPSQIRLPNVRAADGFKVIHGFTGLAFPSSNVIIGDVNGDGFDDMAFGEADAKVGSNWGAGTAYILFGKAEPFASVVDVRQMGARDGFRLSGLQTYEGLGSAIARLGDVNGDGYDDIGVSAEAWHANTAYGASYVVFGKAGGFGTNLAVSSLNGRNGFSIKREPGDTHGQVGYSIDGAGDINGDGYDDLLIGVPSFAKVGEPQASAPAGKSYVVFGKAGGFGEEFAFSSLNGKNGFRLSGGAIHDFTGQAVSDAGDVNGDGFDDIIIGARGRFDGGTQFQGEAYVVFGKAGGFSPTLNLATLNGANGFRMLWHGQFGYSVSSAGDMNGDGFDDVLIGAPTFIGGPDDSDINVGAAYVVFGKADGFSKHVNVWELDGDDGFQIIGDTYLGSIGRGGSSGDINGDGVDDIVIRGSYTNNPITHMERIVIYGKLPTTAVERVGTGADQSLAGGRFNDTLKGMAGEDRVFGNRGNDRLEGGTGDDLLKGGDGNDVLDGGTGADRLFGGAGNDTYVLGRYRDAIVETSGRDTVTSLISRSLGALPGIENLMLLGSANANGTGTASANVFTGNAGANQLRGMAGNDTLSGGGGRDGLKGDAGIDKLTGGAGGDRLMGGSQNDVFVFKATSESGISAPARDTITDFRRGDRIDVSAIDADRTQRRDQKFALDSDATFEAGEIRQKTIGANLLLEFNTDGDAAAEMTILLLNRAALLTAADFRL